jgi:hypothetical protein
MTIWETNENVMDDNIKMNLRKIYCESHIHWRVMVSEALTLAE